MAQGLLGRTLYHLHLISISTKSRVHSTAFGVTDSIPGSEILIIIIFPLFTPITVEWTRDFVDKTDHTTHNVKIKLTLIFIRIKTIHRDKGFTDHLESSISKNH